MPIVPEYDDDETVLAGLAESDAADAKKGAKKKKQDDKKDWKVWRDALASDEESADPKVQKKCKDRLRKALKQNEFKKKKGTRCTSHVYIVLVLFCIAGWVKSRRKHSLGTPECLCRVLLCVGI